MAMGVATLDHLLATVEEAPMPEALLDYVRRILGMVIIIITIITEAIIVATAGAGLGTERKSMRMIGGVGETNIEGSETG